jgi:hypothetical protein
MHTLGRTAARAAIASLALGSACARTPHGGADLIVTHTTAWSAAGPAASMNRFIAVARRRGDP